MKRLLIVIATLALPLVLYPQQNLKNTYLKVPVVDLDGETNRQVVVDRQEGQYLGHVTTVLLDDRKTILAVYPKGHGRGEIVMKKSTDGGLSWSDRLPVPDNWKTSREVPTIFKVSDNTGKERFILFSGLYPARLAVSVDQGNSWSGLSEAGSWGGIVVMSSIVQLNTGNGHYMALFHDDLRFFTADGESVYNADKEKNEKRLFTLYKSFSRDGGLTWSSPEAILSDREMNLCEPGAIRSPDGKTIAVLLRENSRRYNSQIIFSGDEGQTFTNPRPLPAELNGDRHTLKYTKDGRILVVFRDISPAPFRKDLEKTASERKEVNLGKVALETGQGSPTEGDWVGWVGTWDDLVKGTPGQYRIRFKDNIHGWDCCYPGVELLKDGTFVVITYGHWDKEKEPYILAVRFKMKELDKKYNKVKAVQ
ncbi:MAG: sialidase family protein [Bacteroidales bacterium]